MDFSGWELPPLEDDPDRVPPPEREYRGGVWLGSDLVGLRHAGSGALDLGEFVCNDLASVRPTVVGLAQLGSTDFGALSQKERVDALVVIEQHRAWLDGLQQQLLAQVAFGDPSADKWIKEEVACALGLSPVTAGSKLKNAEQLCRRPPGTLGLLLEGRISELQARAVTEASYVMPDEVLPAFEDRVLKRAPEQTLKQLRDVLRRAQHRLDPASAEQRTQRARGDRTVRLTDAGDGMAWLSALLPAEHAQACLARIDAAARMAPREDERTLEQRRADILIDAVLGGLSGELPAQHGLQPNISVIVSLEALAGVEDEPGWLEGYGPITAETARALAADQTGTWRRLVIDPIFGQVIDYGTTRYRPPSHLAELVIARDGTCAFPPCNRPARSCDLDHATPFPDGDTSAENLGPGCRRDHDVDQSPGPRIHQPSPRTLENPRRMINRVTALPIPRYLSQLAATPERADLRSWVATLPSVVAETSRRWSLTVGEPFEPGGQCSWVAPARSDNGDDLVLKVGWPHFVAEHEAAGLQAWQGQGAVEIYAAERLPNADVLLLERCAAGTPLGHSLPELEQDVIVADLLHRLWIKPEPGHPFRPLQSMCQAWADAAEQKFAHSDSTAHRRLRHEGLTLFRELSAPADTDVLLCTDLHGENILAAQRESWLMIDPKPYLGDPAYDPLQHMLNCEDRLHNNPLDLVRRMAELLELDAERVRLWLLARCVQESADEPGLIDVAYRLE